MDNSKTSKSVSVNQLQAELISEVYQFQLRLSSGKTPPLPSITEIARFSNVSRQAIYDWANGKTSSHKIPGKIRELTGLTLPVKLEDPFVNAVKTLLSIRGRVIRYTPLSK